MYIGSAKDYMRPTMWSLDSVTWTHFLALLCATLGLASVRVDNRNTRDFVGHGICEGGSFSDQRRSQSQGAGRG